MEEIEDSAVAETAAALVAELRSLCVQNAPAMRAVRRRYSAAWRETDPQFILRLAEELCRNGEYRWFAYELIENHPAAFGLLDQPELELLGRGTGNWGDADALARTLTGPAWLQGRLPDEAILKWARSDNFWWRRIALVSTVALNMRSRGGTGDAGRTLQICRLLADDHQDMVAKAMSWALRMLAVHDPAAVRKFLAGHDALLAARVKREVEHKLRTGLKNPRRIKTTNDLDKTL